MTIKGSLILIIWLGLIPLAVGAVPALFVNKKRQDLGFMWIAGHIILWAIFQVLCVGLILSEKQLWESDLQPHFPYVVYSFGTVGVVLAILGIVMRKVYSVKQKSDVRVFTLKSSGNKKQYLFWGIFLLLLVIQLVCSVSMQYTDGDDAYYVAVSTITEDSNFLYKLHPYSVGGIGLDSRHSLAPFPIWIAFLSRISGCHTAIVAHTIVSTTLIFMTYVIYGQIGKLIFAQKKEQVPVFLCFTALLVMFGDYSIYTPENFMIARSRQGKAALGNIIVPMVILMFLLLFKRIREQQKTEWMLWLLLGATVTAACLCSTIGTFLMCLMLGIIGLCAGVVYRRCEFVWKTFLCCGPAIVYVLLYFAIG